MKLMRYPKEVKVGPYRFSLEFSPLSVAPGADSGDLGYCLREEQRIIVEKELGRDVIADTVLHEILHAIWFVSGIRDSKEDEEDRIARISPLLLSVMRDNGRLFKILMGDNDEAIRE